MRGLLIAIEGIDGAGKTTQAKRLVNWLRRRGLKAMYTYEPTRSSVGRIIRTRIARGESDGELDALLFAADRLLHYRHVIEPALKDGYHVVSDRYVHSSIAYQGALTGDAGWVRELNRFVPKPDLAVYIDVAEEVGLSRLGRSRTVYERLELLRDVRRIYLELCEKGELSRIDGSGEIAAVQSSVRKLVAGRLGLSLEEED